VKLVYPLYILLEITLAPRNEYTRLSALRWWSDSHCQETYIGDPGDPRHNVPAVGL
jgi:hypothetical protein